MDISPGTTVRLKHLPNTVPGVVKEISDGIALIEHTHPSGAVTTGTHPVDSLELVEGKQAKRSRAKTSDVIPPEPAAT